MNPDQTVNQKSFRLNWKQWAFRLFFVGLIYIPYQVKNGQAKIQTSFLDNLFVVFI
jgi:hypothetical protein